MNNSGFILINKSSGPTSHDIVNQLRKITGIKKIGHAGTLDPFASGLLLIAIGREATREISKFVKLDKEYIAILKLGAISDTYDRTGIITKTLKHLSTKTLNKNKIQKILKNFIGKQEQIPPMYSAKKVKGKKLYELARKGIEIERKPSQIEIYDISLASPDRPLESLEVEGSHGIVQENNLILKINCSSGTYIRSLAHDIGQELKVGAYLKELQRTKIGKFKLTDSFELNKLNNENWQSKLFN